VRRAARVDDNQAAVVAALRKIGASVEIIGKPLDLLVYYRYETSLIEVKNPAGRNKLTDAQLDFLATWPGALYVVRSPEDAIHAVTKGAKP